jgi:DNA-binding IclR family transcriptional regulator
MRQHARRTLHHLVERGVIGQHGKYHLGIANLRDIFRRFGADCNQRLQAFRRTIVYREVMSRLTKAGGHACAHPTQSDKSDFHLFSPEKHSGELCTM